MHARWARTSPNTGRWISPTMTRSPRSRSDIHADHPSMDVVMNIAGVSAWGTVDRLTHEQWSQMIAINLMGPIHVIETFLPPMVAARTRRPSGQRVIGRRAGRVALAWRLQRKQVRAARTVRGAALRPGPSPDRGVGGGARRGRPPLVNTVEIAGVDRDDPRVQRLGGPLQRPRGVTGEGRRQDPRRRSQESVPDLHLG